jgi:hypothetical protein
MFDAMMKKKEDESAKTKYFKKLGWKESDEDGDSITAAIFVYDVCFGFNVFRQGNNIKLLGWFRQIDEAVEFAVDECRKEIASHEIQQQAKPLIK